jgi:hypothetical protein
MYFNIHHHLYDFEYFSFILLKSLMMVVLVETCCWLYEKKLSLDCIWFAFLINDSVILPIND